MKQILTLGILFSFSSMSSAQMTEALFSDCGLAQGFDFYYDIIPPDKQSTRFLKKTTIEGTELLMFELIISGNYDPRSLLQYFRVDGQKVYWYNTNHDPENPSSQQEWLFYDFEPEEGETVLVATINQPGFLIVPLEYTVMEKSTIQYMDGVDRIRMVLQADNNPSTIEWIEGVGNINGGIFRPEVRIGDNLLKCVSNVDGVIWIADDSTEEECEDYLNLLITELGPEPCESTVSVANGKKKYFNIYPNPVIDRITIEKSSHDPVNLIIRDPLGNEIMNTRITTSSENIDCSALNFGYYMIQLIDDQNNVVRTERLIVGNH